MNSGQNSWRMSTLTATRTDIGYVYIVSLHSIFQICLCCCSLWLCKFARRALGVPILAILCDRAVKVLTKWVYCGNCSNTSKESAILCNTITPDPDLSIGTWLRRNGWRCDSLAWYLEERRSYWGLYVKETKEYFYATGEPIRHWIGVIRR